MTTNMVEAIATVSPRLARNRSAVVRVGKVTAVATNGFCTVNVGGGTVTANYLEVDKPAVNGIVALVNDRDVWIVVGTLSTGANDANFLQFPSAYSWDTSIASYANLTTAYTQIPGPSATITKQRANTRLRITAGGMFHTVTASVGANFAVRLSSMGAVNYSIAQVHHTLAFNNRLSWIGVLYFSGCPAGAVTVTPWAAAEVAGDGVHLDTYSHCFVDVMEIS